MVKSEDLKIESRTVGTRITKAMYEKVIEFLATNAHVSISDYLRDLVRRDLESKGVIYEVNEDVERGNVLRAGSVDVPAANEKAVVPQR